MLCRCPHTTVVAVGRLIGLIMGFDTVQVTAQALPNDTNDSLEMKLVISNNTASPIRINHTSGQKYDFVLFDAENNEVYIWSADRMFIDALTKTVIEPAQTIVFSETLDGDAYAAIKDDIRLLKAVITGTSDDLHRLHGYVCFVPESVPFVLRSRKVCIKTGLFCFVMFPVDKCRRKVYY